VSDHNPIDLLSRISPVSDEDASAMFGASGKENLLDAITALSSGRERRAIRRLRRPLVLAVAAVVVAGAAGAAWAMTRGSARETTAVDCQIGGGTTVIDATSGDPAADCAAIWPAPVPKLKAYSDGVGGVAVIPASEKAPAGWMPIASQDVALIELQETLDDNINGLDSSCFSSTAATTFTQQELNRLGFIGWSVNVRPPAQQQNAQPPAGTKAAPGVSGGQACYGGFADPASKTVTLFGGGDQSGAANWPPHQLADSLRPLTQQCLSLSAMETEVVQRATALGMSQTVEGDHNYELNATKDNTISCSTVYETVEGTVDVVVRGPATP
jgi:hypothetical protein